jgi:hypothetical protein
MDRYDAILEHLKKAQNQGLDSVATRLDTIVESLGELIQSARTTVQSARPTDAEEVLPLAEVETLVAELRHETGRPAGISIENLRTLDAARSQSELLRALLPMLSDHVGRAVVLVIRDGVISAWSGIGFADGEKLRTWHGGVAASPHFQNVVETSKPLRVSPQNDPLLSEWLQDDVIPDEGVLLPISLRGKLMGIVYMDHHGSQAWNIETAQSLNAIACLFIDTLHHRSRVPTATLAEIAVAETQQESFVDDEVFQPPPEPEVPEPPPEVVIEEPSTPEIVVEETPAPAVFEPTPADEPVAPPPAAPEFDVGGEDAIEFEPVSDEDFQEPAVAEDVPAIDYDFEPEPAPTEPEAAGAGFDPSATVRIDATDAIPSPEAPPQPPEIPTPAPPPPAEIPAPASPPPEGIDEPSAVELEAPPPVRPVEPPPEPAAGAVAPDEDARQEEARRFARLLVSEIKLYNEDEVERGRAEKDIGARLKEDIDRSREMYEKRIPADVRQGHDYFRDELVRILADGDADALGV